MTKDEEDIYNVYRRQYSVDELARVLVSTEQHLGVQRKGNVALMGVFIAAAKLCDAWEAAASHSEAKVELQRSVEAYRELIAPLGGSGP